MKEIQQLYCTHCSAATNALFVADGATNAREAVGYSVRAGSVQVGDLRHLYREVEPFLSYALPTDTPNDERATLTAESPHAPRRLFYAKSASGRSISGQLCYRQKATDGRLQSYFGHVLTWTADATGRLHQARTALQLWGARGWVLEDSPELDKHLEPLESPRDLLAGQDPAVNDDLVLDFLTVTENGAFRDQAHVLPDRWRSQTAKRRQDVFRALLTGFLETGVNPRAPVVLVAEPSAAALLFYAVLRVLPEGCFASEVTVSTYASNVRRSDASLAATVFVDPKTDLPRDAYMPGRGWAMNTFPESGGLRTPGRGAPSNYADVVLSLLRAPNMGWPVLDAFLEDLHQAGAVTFEQLEELAAARAAVAEICQTGVLRTAKVNRESGLVQKYLHNALKREILAGSGTVLEQSRLIELLNLALLVLPDAGSADLVSSLAHSEHLGAIVRAPNIGTPWKALIVAEAIKAQGAIPSECADLWQAGKGPVPLKAVVQHLNSKAIAGLYEQATDRAARLDLIVACAQAGKYSGEGRLLDEMVKKTLAKTKPEVLFARLARNDALAAFGKGAAPSLDTWLHLQVAAIVRGIIDGREHWEHGYRQLQPLSRLMRDKDSKCLQFWAGCHEQIARLQQTPPQTIEFDKTCHALVDHFKTALDLSHEMLADHSDAKGLFDKFMYTWGGEWQKIPLPQKTKIQPYLDGEPWQETSAVDFRKLATDKRVLAAAALLLVGVIGLAIGWAMSGRPKDSATSATDKDTNPIGSQKAEPINVVAKLPPSTEGNSNQGKSEDSDKSKTAATPPENPRRDAPNDEVIAMAANATSNNLMQQIETLHKEFLALHLDLQTKKETLPDLKALEGEFLGLASTLPIQKYETTKAQNESKKPQEQLKKAGDQSKPEPGQSKKAENRQRTATIEAAINLPLTHIRYSLLAYVGKPRGPQRERTAPDQSLHKYSQDKKKIVFDLSNPVYATFELCLESALFGENKLILGMVLKGHKDDWINLDQDWTIQLAKDKDNEKALLQRLDKDLANYETRKSTITDLESKVDKKQKELLALIDKTRIEIINLYSNLKTMQLQPIVRSPEPAQSQATGIPTPPEGNLIITFRPQTPFTDPPISLPKNMQVRYDLEVEIIGSNSGRKFVFHLPEENPQFSPLVWDGLTGEKDPKNLLFRPKYHNGAKVKIIPYVYFNDKDIKVLGKAQETPDRYIDELKPNHSYLLAFKAVDEGLRTLLQNLNALDRYETEIQKSNDTKKGQ